MKAVKVNNLKINKMTGIDLFIQQRRIEAATNKKVFSINCSDVKYRHKKMYKIDVIITMNSNNTISSVLQLVGLGESMELATEEILNKYKNTGLRFKDQPSRSPKKY